MVGRRVHPSDLRGLHGHAGQKTGMSRRYGPSGACRETGSSPDGAALASSLVLKISIHAGRGVFLLLGLKRALPNLQRMLIPSLCF